MFNVNQSLKKITKTHKESNFILKESDNVTCNYCCCFFLKFPVHVLSSFLFYLLYPSMVIYYFRIIDIIFIITWRGRYEIMFNHARNLDLSLSSIISNFFEKKKFKLRNMFTCWSVEYMCLCMWNIVNIKLISNFITSFTQIVYFCFKHT